jgi:flagellar biosynthesis regulator FlaF
MRKIFILVITINFFIINSAQALNMKSLDDFFKIHSITDPTAQIYAFQRCGALYGMVSPYASDDRKKVNIAVTAALFTAKAQTIYSKINNKNSSESEKKILAEIIKIQEFYEEDSNEIYLKESSKFAGYISLDLVFCRELEKTFN